MKQAIQIAKETFQEFSEDKCPRMAAALAYYTIFSLPPLLVLIIQVAVFFGADNMQGQIVNQISDLIGPDAAEQVKTMIASASGSSAETIWARWLGLAALVFGATGALAQLQDALNTAWQVAPDPERGGLKNFVFKRLLSLGMILGIAFLLLVSLVLSAGLAAFGDVAAQYLPGFLSGGVLMALNAALSLAIIAFLFAAMFKVLPDAHIAWRDVGVGALFTAVLFVAGKFAISFYLGRSDISSTYGAAGSLALILVWIYLSSIILFLGAEFTQVYARHLGNRIVPEENAVRVIREERYERADGTSAGRKKNAPNEPPQDTSADTPRGKDKPGDRDPKYHVS